MKKLSIVSLCLVLIICFTSCTGKTGPTGPAGLDGPEKQHLPGSESGKGMLQIAVNGSCDLSNP